MSTLSCDRIQGLISQALSGELDEARRAEVLSHAEHCPACGTQYRFEQRLNKALAADPLTAPSPLYLEGVLAEIHQRMPVIPPSPPRRRLWGRPQVATAFMAALVMVWVGASLGTFMPGSLTGGKEQHAQLRSLAASAAMPERPARLVAVAGLGLVPADSSVLKLPPDDLRQLGVKEEGLEAIRLYQERKGVYS